MRVSGHEAVVRETGGGPAVAGPAVHAQISQVLERMPGARAANKARGRLERRACGGPVPPAGGGSVIRDVAAGERPCESCGRCAPPSLVAHRDAPRGRAVQPVERRRPASPLRWRRRRAHRRAAGCLQRLGGGRVGSSGVLACLVGFRSGGVQVHVAWHYVEKDKAAALHAQAGVVDGVHLAGGPRRRRGRGQW
jgi:hypothetical protein